MPPQNLLSGKAYGSTSCQEHEMHVTVCLKNRFEFAMLKHLLTWDRLSPAYPGMGTIKCDQEQKEKPGVFSGWRSNVTRTIPEEWQGYPCFWSRLHTKQVSDDDFTHKCGVRHFLEKLSAAPRASEGTVLPRRYDARVRNSWSRGSGSKMSATKARGTEFR